MLLGVSPELVFLLCSTSKTHLLFTLFSWRNHQNANPLQTSVGRPYKTRGGFALFTSLAELSADFRGVSPENSARFCMFDFRRKRRRERERERGEGERRGEKQKEKENYKERIILRRRTTKILRNCAAKKQGKGP